MSPLIAQTAEGLEAGYKFADRFGFDALVAVVLLIGGGYFLKNFLEYYKNTTSDLATAQKNAWMQQVDNGKESLALTRQLSECVTSQTASTKAIEQTIIALTKNTDERHRAIERLVRHSDATHQALRRGFQAAANGLECTDPVISKELQSIADQLASMPDHH